MRCPKCGNEVGPDEAFCGQCGTPMTSPAHPTEMVYTPPRSGLLNSYNTNRQSGPGASSAGNAQNSGMMPPPNAYHSNVPGGSVTPHQSTLQSAGAQQQTDFYQDTTEAMSSVPNSNPQSFPGTPVQGSYAGTGQYGSQPQGQQPLQAGGYPQHGDYTQVPFAPGQSYGGYGVQPHVTPLPQKQQANPVLVVASVLLALALIVAIVFGALYFTRGHSPKVSITPTTIPTTVPTPTPTAMPSPTPTDTPTPIPTPSPTAVPTPAPDANFSWCGATCTANGFIVEYPNGWNQEQTSTGVQFLNPTQQDIYANFKASQAQANSNADELIDADLQSTYASQSGYVAPTSKSTTAFGKDNWTWTYATAYYQLNSQKERVVVFATVHLGRSYVIELEAPDSQFDTLNTQYFAIMLNRFQFQESTT